MNRPRFLGPSARMGTFTVDADSTGSGRGTWEPFINTWNERMGQLYPVPEFTPSTVERFTGTMRSITLDDTAINEFWASSPVGTQSIDVQEQDQVRLYVGLRGHLALREPAGQGADVDVAAGTYFLHHCVRENHFQTTPVIAARIFILPGEAFRALAGGQPRTGPADSPAAQILMAHVSMLQRSLGDLGPASARASRNALHELVKGLIVSQFDDQETTFAPALAQAARDLAEAHLSEPDLSPTMVATRLHVSIRTLQRAFAAQESLDAYIRRRRLQAAAAALIADGSSLSVSQAGARWGYGDSSHFIRAFRKQYGMTPRQYRTLNRPGS